MGRWWLLLVFAWAGCGGGEAEPIAPACVEGTRPIERALQQAPDGVALADGTSLSRCVSGAMTAAELQEFGVLATTVADRLELRAARDARAALRLGYLIGATRRGAERTNGLHLELARRLEATAALEDASPAARAALARGLQAGQARG